MVSFQTLLNFNFQNFRDIKLIIFKPIFLKKIKFKCKQIFQLNFQINKLTIRLFQLFQNHDHLDIFHNWKKFLENSLIIKINRTISTHQKKLRKN